MTEDEKLISQYINEISSGVINCFLLAISGLFDIPVDDITQKEQDGYIAFSIPFMARGAKYTYVWIPNNTLLEIASVDRDLTPIKFDKKLLYDSDYAEQKIADTVFSRIILAENNIRTMQEKGRYAKDDAQEFIKEHGEGFHRLKIKFPTDNNGTAINS